MTAAMLDEAIDRIWKQGYRVCPHAVHPRHANRRLARTAEEVEVTVRCGICGNILYLTKEVTNA